MIDKPCTAAMLSALKWLRTRNADGVFDRSNVLIAAGERAGVMRRTWNLLEGKGLIEHYADRRRIRVTDKGHAIDLSSVRESDTTEMSERE